MLVEGKWTEDWHPVHEKNSKGEFRRKPSSFRSWITPDGSPGPTGEGGFRAEAGRYHLYVALSCPWASRTLAVRVLKRLEDVISVSVVEPVMTNQGWRFGEYPGADWDEINGTTYLHEIYTKADPAYTGRATVPVLWDKQRQTIVNNESSDIIRMLNAAFDTFTAATIDLYPKALRDPIDALNEEIYLSLNNGVYRAGFAQSQEAYDEACRDVFAMLDELETRLEGQTYLFSDKLTETDIRLFVTLVRFDAAYHGAFKCNLRRLSDYRNLSAYLHRLLVVPGLADTVSIDHIKRGYYALKAINPSGIVPLGPELDLPGVRS